MTDKMHNFQTKQVAAAMPGAPSDNVLTSVAGLGTELEIEVVVGEAGIAHLNADGSEQGFLQKLKRTVQEEQGPITILSDALAAGDHVVFVHNVDDDNVDKVVSALQEAGASIQFYFGDLTWRRFDV